MNEVKLSASAHTRVTQRCTECELPPRWCVCEARREIRSPLKIDLLTHQLERYRPGSTGGLIKRVVSGCRQHIWHMEDPLSAAAVTRPGREVWILHPSGEPAPLEVEAKKVQLLMLDGSWSETAAMARDTASWGRLVSLPVEGSSRFLGRDCQKDGRYSTAEALLYMLEFFKLNNQRDLFRYQFELHVFASLCARGRVTTAKEFLSESVINATLPDKLEQFHRRQQPSRLNSPGWPC